MDDFRDEKGLFRYFWIGDEFKGTYRVERVIFGEESQKWTHFAEYKYKIKNEE
jgi:hypothetical protein